MWIVVMGATCTGKRVIIKELTSSFEFEHLKDTESKNQIDVFGSRLANQVKAQKMGLNKHVVTTRSIWDTAEVMIENGVKFNSVSRPTRDALMRIYNQINTPSVLTAPHAVIWTKTTGMSASDFANLKETSVSFDEFNYQSDLYEKFASKIAVPLITIDMSQNMADAIKEINFMVNSVKSSGLHAHTAWKKDMFI